ncbi:hypothetical protein O181_079529 [Austropuccinia psidii MF-1]|uniref:Uncharacterized protein n=1 Tax=Austropuccinia psidii MF-1 TaxID=1389203 RepID=A0A9Q3IIB2_9BASI|nr:hypothetical protein [Austropuccinia psidii MF-1]
MSPAHLRDLGFQRNQPEDREGLFITRRPGKGHLGHSGGCQKNEGDNINLAFHTPIQQEPQTRGLEGYQSSSSAPPTPQRFISTKHGQKEVLQGPYCNHQRLESYAEVQTPGGKGTEDKGESRHYPSYKRTANPDSPTQIPSGSQGAGQISSPVASHHSETSRLVAKSHHSSQLQEVSRIRQGNKGKNKTSFNQRRKESDPMIQKLLDLVKEVHKNQK